MTRGNLPPQAFSSQDMSQALKWLEGQPSHIKNMAKSTEALMSLYRQATIYKEEFYNKYPPKSEERFRQDLNDIASQLNDFSDSPKEQTAMTSQVSPLSYDDSKDFIEKPKPSEPPKAPEKPKIQESKITFDPISQERLKTVKEKLNLSSEQEALRMLISLGFERFTKL